MSRDEKVQMVADILSCYGIGNFTAVGIAGRIVDALEGWRI